MGQDPNQSTTSPLTRREGRLLLRLMKHKTDNDRRRHIPDISVLSLWPTSVPKILATPFDGNDLTAHLRCTPMQIAEAIHLAGTRPPSPSTDGINSPVPRDEWEAASKTLIEMVEGSHFGAALMFTWNMASRWAFEHGLFSGENGQALQRQVGRDRFSKVGKMHGGPKPGSGRKPKVSLERALAAFNATDPKRKLRWRYEAAARELDMQPEGLRKRLARAKTITGQTN